jgi:Tfp pilus assembly protein PilW
VNSGRRRRRVRGDAGVTLIELIVTMGVMIVVMAIFTAEVIQVVRSVGTSENTATSQTQLRLALQMLDREVRYASGITVPSSTAVGGAWYVEFLAADPTTGQPVCRQLRLDSSGVLQQLSWTPGSPPAAGTPGQTLASELVSPGGAVPLPFDRQVAGSLPYATPSAGAAPGSAFSPDYQRLRLRLTTRTGTTTTSSDVTFTALNTSRTTRDSNVCIEGRPT